MTPPFAPRLLFAAPACLLDTSSGAAITVRQILRCLSEQGLEVGVLGAGIFDAPAGKAAMATAFAGVQPTQTLAIDDGAVRHRVMATQDHRRLKMTCEEEGRFFMLFLKQLETFRPDMLLLMGGHLLDMQMAAEAKRLGIPVMAFLYNARYFGRRWCRDVDWVVTDSQATADLYRQRQGIEVTPLGTFIDPRRVVAETHQPRELLFVNPAWAKGAAWVAHLALVLERLRPEIPITVVASRGDWPSVVRQVTRQVEGQAREHLANVRLVAHTRDMRPYFAQARLLLAPSLWWESGARVLGEALLNGVPVLTTDRGGSAEMIGAAGHVMALDGVWHEPPYHGPAHAEIDPEALAFIFRLFDEPAFHARLVTSARREARARHDMQRNTQRLLANLQPLLSQRAGSQADYDDLY